MDLTDPFIAKQWGYIGGEKTPYMQYIGEKAKSDGFNAIRFNSERAVGGKNIAILNDFNLILKPQMVTSIKIKYKCLNCDASFFVPELSDFSYGEFILESDSGEFKYLNAFEDPTYQEVIKLIEENKDKIRVQPDVQSIYGQLVCDPDSKGFQFSIRKTSCPKCRSINLNSGSVTEQKICLDLLTHDKWDLLDKKTKLLLYIQQITKIEH